MSNYTPPPDDRYPPDDSYPPRNVRRPSASRGDDGSGFKAPDLRQRSALYRESQQRNLSGNRRQVNYEDEDEGYEDTGAKPKEESLTQRFKRGIGGFSGMDWLFVVALVLAAARGMSNTRGCLPTRRCMNVMLINIIGIGLIVGGIYYASTASNSNSTVTLAMSGGGVLLCLFGGGGVIGLLIGALKMIDLDNFGNNALEDMGGGFLDNILGRR